MQKLGTGYSMYFNQKYKRVGGLFQGRFKAIRVEKQGHFLHLPFYIHANPVLKYYGGSTSIHWKMAMKRLENYRWSSFPDYIGKKNFPSVTSRKFITDFYGGEKKYLEETKKLMKEWRINLEDVRELLLDTEESKNNL